MHYLDGGPCALPTEFMCIEWLKVNAPAPPTPRPAPLTKTLFGDPIRRISEIDTAQVPRGTHQTP